MKLKTLTLLLMFVAFVFHGHAQKIKNKIVISGHVKDSLNRPVAGAAIFIDGVKLKEKTNAQGYYKLKLKKVPRKITMLSFLYGIQEVVFDGSSVVNINYGKESVNVTDKDPSIVRQERPKEFTPTQPTFTNIYDYLRTKVPGISVSGDNKVLVRGATSFNSSTEPLFIVNQSAISSLQGINPNEIKSISVLKGPECAAYGIRGANGVIIISTF